MKARIATVCQAGSFYRSVEENRKHVMKLLDLALRQEPDLVCLPETFTTVSVDGKPEDLAEAVPGPTTEAVSKRAKANDCYVICPINTRRGSKIWNSAIVIDRSGEVLGIYDKVHPVTTSSDYTVFEDGVMPGIDVPVFDLDFGRIGIQICYDIGFPESWEELSKKGARMVFWCSAYNGGFPLQVYAYLHHYYVVSSVRTDKSKIIDPCGTVLAETDQHVNVACRDVNLDFVVSHYDFNYSIPDKIMEAYPGRVEVRSHLDEGHFLVEPIDDSLTTALLQKEFGFESTFQYHQRHRDAYKLILQGKQPPPQKAAHGNRPQWSKVDG
ncbi:MAG: carbon-nitrogen hydrolase family protein [Candidatus Brockarchaeota archaeon]|nr:carbon-nitrogen hydrolase family protein [Candidatus Brockarchaeota archaeon]